MPSFQHISFTAHYTAYVWYQMGISHPVFATRQGYYLAKLLRPIDYILKQIQYSSIHQALVQRHQIIDLELEKLIVQYPKLQVLEIACGLSPRGWAFRKKYPGLCYRELDLAEMATLKQQLLDKIEINPPAVLNNDIFSNEMASVFAQFDSHQPLVIISEGLLNYLTPKLMQQLWQNLNRQSSSFQLDYLADLYPYPAQHQRKSVLLAASWLLKKLSKSGFALSIQNPQMLQQLALRAGFEKLAILLPSQYLNSPYKDLVWVLHAKRQPSSR